MASLLRSPLRGSAENPIRPPPQEKRGEEPMASPLRSPLRRDENPIPLPSPAEKSPFNGATEEETADSPLRNPIPPAPHNTPEKPRPPAPAATAATAAALAIANRLARDDLAVVAKMVAGSGGGAGGGEFGSNVTGDAERRYRAVPPTVRRAAVMRLALGLRVSAMVLCLVSFSVMAADKTKGWAGDSFDRYEEYRYCISVNIIAFVYSAFQVIVEAHHLITKKYIVRHQMRYHFDFSMDQILAYLLISASSAASSRNDVWVSRFGGDGFTRMINGSVAMSFLAFITLALSSIISAYNLFSWNL